MRTIILAMFATIFGFATAYADKLPKDSIKLSEQEIRSIYSSKSSNWTRSNAYFAPGGSYLIVGKNEKFIGKGTWAVKDNSICANFRIVGVEDGGFKDIQDCWTWYRKGKTLWSIWSGEKDKTDGYYNGELKKLVDGDTVSKKYKQLAKSN